MKLLSESNKVISNGVMKKTKARVHNSPKIFMMLSSSLYNDKIAAPIREIGCNAIDAHIAAKNDKPFYCHMPTLNEPWFSVRDYGLGMDSQELDELYLTYGLSTKDDNDEVIGCFGLGSKSPLAYVKDNFTVTSIKNGIKYSGVVSLDENGEPETNYFPEVLTNEPSGLEVKFNVQRADIDIFNTNIKNIYSYFGKYIPKTNALTIKEVSYAETHPEYSIPVVDTSYPRYNNYNYNVNNQQSYAIMGYIKYPIDAAQFPKYSALLNQGYHYYFNVGDVEMNISREGLQYNKKTINAINDRLEKVLTKLSATLQKELDACKSQFEVMKLLFKPQNKAKLTIIQNKLSWEGKPVKLNIYYENFPVESYYQRGSKTKRNELTQLSITEYDVTGKEVFLINDTQKNCTFMCNHFAEEGKVYLLKGGDKKTIDNLLADKVLDKSDITYVSTKYDEIREIVRKKNAIIREKLGIYSKKKIFKFVPSVNRQRAQQFWKEEEIDIDDGGVYVEINRYEPNNTVVFNNNALASLVTSMSTFGITMPDIIGVKTSDVEKLAEHDDWQSLKEFCSEQLQEYIKKNKLEDFLSIVIKACGEYGNNVLENSYSQYELLLKSGRIKSGTFVDTINNLKKANKVYLGMRKNTYTYQLVRELFGDKMPKATLTLENLYKKYPILSVYDGSGTSKELVKHLEDYILAIDNGTF